jgi:hypothetical protein
MRPGGRETMSAFRGLGDRETLAANWVDPNDPSRKQSVRRENQWNTASYILRYIDTLPLVNEHFSAWVAGPVVTSDGDSYD